MFWLVGHDGGHWPREEGLGVTKKRNVNDKLITIDTLSHKVKKKVSGIKER